MTWSGCSRPSVKEDRLLISQDAFGQHLASSARFDDEYCDQYSISALEHAVRDYYANILMPFGTLVKAKLAEVRKLGLEIDMIAPDHGIIWRKDPGKILQMYLDMANDKAAHLLLSTTPPSPPPPAPHADGAAAGAPTG